MTNPQGIRKAAMFLNGLDWETAGSLLKRLPPEESRAIRHEMVAIEGISPSEINKTVRQFLKDTNFGFQSSGIGFKHQARSPKPEARSHTTFSDDGDLFELSGQSDPTEHAGVTYPAAQATRNEENEVKASVDPEITELPAEPIVDEKTAEPQPRRFDYLECRSAFETAGFLAEEGEQLIAVVLSQMTPRYSGDVLACFEQSLKRDLIRRLAKLDATDETILDEIDVVLKDRLKREVEDRPITKPGLALLEQILQVVENELDNEIGNDIISGLNEIDMEERLEAGGWKRETGVGDMHSTAYSLQTETYWTFDDLGLLEDHELAALFRSQDRDLVVKSLVSCDPYFVERVLGLFPVYEQVNLREMLCFAESIDYAEQDYARQCVLSGMGDRE